MLETTREMCVWLLGRRSDERTEGVISVANQSELRPSLENSPLRAP